MATRKAIKHRYPLNKICVFTNRGTSGVTSNDGKLCKITRLKPPEEWTKNEPGYVIQFFHNGNAFGVLESEIAPASKQMINRQTARNGSVE